MTQCEYKKRDEYPLWWFTGHVYHMFYDQPATCASSYTDRHVYLFTVKDPENVDDTMLCAITPREFHRHVTHEYVRGMGCGDVRRSLQTDRTTKQSSEVVYLMLAGECHPICLKLTTELFARIRGRGIKLEPAVLQCVSRFHSVPTPTVCSNVTVFVWIGLWKHCQEYRSSLGLCPTYKIYMRYNSVGKVWAERLCHPEHTDFT